MAPELNRSGPYLGPPVDLWAYGCLVYEAMHAQPAFRGESMQQLQLRIKRAAHEAVRKDLSPAYRALLGGCLTHDAAARASAAAVLAHPWLDFE